MAKRYTDKQKAAKLAKYNDLKKAAKAVGVSYVTLLKWEKASGGGKKKSSSGGKERAGRPRLLRRQLESL
ncbi:MAG: hypothetical protein DRP79_07630 [Planctomycetota bacterium]|nr:MAG: hypothetical protein DRP79_07630 [Planctomycetota bacterium]